MATQIQQRRAIAHNRMPVMAGVALVAVAAISGALILSTLIRPASQATWSLTNPSVSIHRPAGVGVLRFADQPAQLNAQQVAERYAVKTGFLESAGDGSYNRAADQYLTRSRNGLKTGFLESAGDGEAAATTQVPAGVQRGFQP